MCFLPIKHLPTTYDLVDYCTMYSATCFYCTVVSSLTIDANVDEYCTIDEAWIYKVNLSTLEATPTLRIILSFEFI